MGRPECGGKKVLVSGASPFDPQSRIRPFKAAACEVTNGEYRVFEAGNAGSGFELVVWRSTRPQLEVKLAGDNQPVGNVTATEAEAYCKAQLDESGNPGRLPTGEEWQKMARGPKGYDYGTEDGTLKCGKNASCAANASSDVGSFASNGWVHDATGNVWEWTKESNGNKIIRGGSWLNIGSAGNLRADYLLSFYTGVCDDYVGFRCVWPQDPKK